MKNNGLDEEKGEWYFSVVDVVAVLRESKGPAAYWGMLGFGDGVWARGTNIHQFYTK